jgi:hypothetical protein
MAGACVKRVRILHYLFGEKLKNLLDISKIFGNFKLSQFFSTRRQHTPLRYVYSQEFGHGRHALRIGMMAGIFPWLGIGAPGAGAVWPVGLGVAAGRKDEISCARVF